MVIENKEKILLFLSIEFNEDNQVKNQLTICRYNEVIVENSRKI
ncbi:hypothetical protein SAMN05428977_100492 [Nitrosomonas sp. Nm166]|nr:hypothetical protein SAMN05428977_100492 [Nitrosomonas sp. Nm166]